MARHVDVDRARPPSFALAEDLSDVDTRAHAHTRHQLLYAASGTLHLEVADALWILPPQRAAWIEAGLSHRVRVRGRAALRTVYFTYNRGRGLGCRVFDATPLAREMLLHAMRWGPAHDPRDPVARPFFALLARLAIDWARDARPWSLPAAKSAEVARAMRFVLDRLGSPISASDAARASGMSTRTMARRFAEETHAGFGAFLHRARMLRAMERLAGGARVTETAFEVGFASLGAFSAAFTRAVGETPKAYRARCMAPTRP
jgi:AraC-like DNA-binding protein